VDGIVLPNATQVLALKFEITTAPWLAKPAVLLPDDTRPVVDDATTVPPEEVLFAVDVYPVIVIEPAPS
jgi:hypothetical protein